MTSTVLTRSLQKIDKAGVVERGIAKDGNKYHIDARGYRVKYKYKVKGPGERKPRGRPRIQNIDDRKIITLEETLYHFPQKGETDLTKRFQCDRCVRKFELEEDYKQHVHRHEVTSPDKAFACFFCSEKKTFSKEEDYMAHLQGYFFQPTNSFNTLISYQSLQKPINEALIGQIFFVLKVK